MLAFKSSQAAWLKQGLVGAELEWRQAVSRPAKIGLKLVARQVAFDSPDGQFAGEALRFNLRADWADVDVPAYTASGRIVGGELLLGDFYRDFNGGGLDFDLVLPERAVLEADVGLAPLRGRRDHWHPANALLAVSVHRGDTFERLGAIRLPGGHAAPAPWRPLEVDLAPAGPGPAQLRLELEPDPGEPPSSLAWWGSPRIVSRGPDLR